MPYEKDKAVHIKDKRIRREQEVKYMDYIFKYFDTLNDDELIDACVDIVDKLMDVDPETPETKAASLDLFNKELRGDLRKTAADSSPQGQKQHLAIRYATYCGVKAMLQEGVFLVNSGDAIKHNFHIVNPKDINKPGVKLIPFEVKKLRLHQAAHDFKLVCEELKAKHDNLKNDKEFNELYAQFIVFTDSINDVWKETGQASEFIDGFMKHVDKIDIRIQQLKIHDIKEDMAYIYLLLCLHRFRTWTDTYALYLTILHAAYRGRTFAYALANAAYNAVASAVGAAGNAIVAAAGYPLRKGQRLWDQAILKAFRQEYRRFSEEARRIWRTPRDKASIWEVGSHLKKPLNLTTGVVFRGATLMLYVPAKVAMGAMNERYSFINQVKLNVTGSTLRDKSAFREDGQPMFQLTKTDDTKKSNNRLLLVQTSDYNPLHDTGAAVIVGKESKGHSIFLIAHSAEAGQKMLDLLCKAVKDSDGTKLEIHTRVPPEDVDIEVVEGFIKNLKPEYKHIDIVVNEKSINPDSRKKSKI